MNWKRLATPLILLFAILGLATLAYWDEKETASDKVLEAGKGLLFDFDPAKIVSIEVSNVSAEPQFWTLVQDQKAKTWTVATPLSYSADGEGIERLLKIIVEAKSERTFERDSRALDTFGLSPAQIVYVMKDGKGKSWRFAIGGKSPTGYSSYAMIGDEGSVHLVNQYLFTATNKTLADFRNRSLGLAPVALVKNIDVHFAGQEPIRLERQANDWRITRPFQVKGDTLDINKWISGWDMIRVVDFIDSPDPALRKALTVIGKGTKELVRIRFDTGSLQKELIVVENNEKVYTQLGDSTFVELDRTSIESLLKSPRDFEDRSVFQFASSDVTQIAVDGVSYIKEKAGWIQASNHKPMPFVQGMLVSLEFVKADSKLTGKDVAESVSAPPLHVVVIQEGDKAPLEFSIWKKLNIDDGKSEPMLVLKVGDSFYQVKYEFLDLLKPKSPTIEPTLGGEIKGEKS